MRAATFNTTLFWRWSSLRWDTQIWKQCIDLTGKLRALYSLPSNSSVRTISEKLSLLTKLLKFTMRAFRETLERLVRPRQMMVKTKLMLKRQRSPLRNWQSRVTLASIVYPTLKHSGTAPNRKMFPSSIGLRRELPRHCSSFFISTSKAAILW
jgi:hypothetical protein